MKLENSSNLISIVIPAYEMHGKGDGFLNFSLEKISSQTYKNIEVIVSDQSQNSKVEDVCKKWIEKGISLTYLRNPDNLGNSSANLNKALTHAAGKYIKVIFQDDFLFSPEAIEKTELSFRENPERSWLVSACAHSPDGHKIERPFYPNYNNEIHLGNNTISSPSVLSIRNKDLIYFDENLIWLMDVDYYKRLYDKFGEPIILNEITVVNRIWKKQLSNTISSSVKSSELNYIKEKYLK